MFGSQAANGTRGCTTIGLIRLKRGFCESVEVPRGEGHRGLDLLQLFESLAVGTQLGKLSLNPFDAQVAPFQLLVGLFQREGDPVEVDVGGVLISWQARLRAVQFKPDLLSRQIETEPRFARRHRVSIAAIRRVAKHGLQQHSVTDARHGDRDPPVSLTNADGALCFETVDEDVFHRQRGDLLNVLVRPRNDLIAEQQHGDAKQTGQKERGPHQVHHVDARRFRRDDLVVARHPPVDDADGEQQCGGNRVRQQARHDEGQDLKNLPMAESIFLGLTKRTDADEK